MFNVTINCCHSYTKFLMSGRHKKPCNRTPTYWSKLERPFFASFSQDDEASLACIVLAKKRPLRTKGFKSEGQFCFKVTTTYKRNFFFPGPTLCMSTSSPEKEGKTQCINFNIFRSMRFYGKSILINERVIKTAILIIFLRSSEILFCKISVLERCENEPKFKV